jgi:hypothetical protein
MCSRPVTFGGGMTITNRGAVGGPAGWKRPSASQTRYQRSSKEEGSKVFSSLREASADSGTAALSDIKCSLEGL